MGDELKTIVNIVGQGGIAMVMLVVWYITSQRSTAVMAESFKKHHDLEETLIQLLKDEQQFKIELLSAIGRLEVKLESPVQCPFAAVKSRDKGDIHES